jgi:hypothetical protein
MTLTIHLFKNYASTIGFVCYMLYYCRYFKLDLHFFIFAIIFWIRWMIKVATMTTIFRYWWSTSHHVLGLVPHRKLMVGEHNIKVGGQSSPIRLVFWVELGPGPVVVGSGGPNAWWASARGYSGSGRIHMVTGEPVTGEIVRFSPTSEIDGGGAQHNGGGQSSPIRLVFWVELGPGPAVVGSGGPKAWWASARGYSGSGRILLHHSNKWYQSQRSENLGKHLRVTWWRGNPWRGRLLGLVPHRKLMVGEHNIKVRGSPHPLG